MHSFRTILIAVPLMAAFAGATARADVRDNGRIFSADAIAKAKATISDIEKHYHRRVVVETFAEIPSDKLASYDVAGKDKAARAKFFRDWLRDRAKADGATGVFVLICKQPGHIEVEADTETHKKDFTSDDVRELRSQLVEAFQEKKFDDGLIAGVDFIETAMKSHQGIKTQPEVAKPAAVPQVTANHGGGGGMSIMGMVCIIGGIVLFFWVAAALIRAFTGMGRSMGGGAGPGMGGPGYVGGGGGGFMSNFMGGMFGSMAGNWMYNSFFGGQSSGMHWDNPTYGGDAGSGGGSAGNFDGNSAGGDFGGDDAGAGGDFGGDAGGGGGFFGGGDAGGGGGDFGGGGGGDFGGGGGDF
jgi:TPM domain